MPRFNILACAALMFGLAVPGAVARSQQPPAARPDSAKPNLSYRNRILGVYDQQSGEPVEGVEVLDILAGNRSLTTKTGTVSLVFLPDGGSMVRIRKVGFAPQTFMVSISPADTTPVTVILARTDAVETLPTVVVRDSAVKYFSAGLQGFEERRRSGFGHFISEAEMRKDDNHTMADVIISHFPGLMVVPGRLGAVYIGSARKMCAGGALATCMNPSCYPTVLVDGVKSNLGQTVGRAIDWSKVSPTDYAAAEFYAGPASAPPEFSGGNNECGILLLWTRER